jgi:hypothetical protein
VDHFVGEARRGEDAGEELELAGSVSDFFFQFACRAGLGVFTRMKFSRRNFVDEPPCRVAELPNQYDRAIVLQRHHSGRSRMAHNFQVDRKTVGQRDGVDVQIHDDTCIDLFGLHRLNLALLIERWLDDVCGNALATDFDQDGGASLCIAQRHIAQPNALL